MNIKLKSWIQVLLCCIFVNQLYGCSMPTEGLDSFNVPLLINKDIDEVIQFLGTPWDNRIPTSNDIKSGVQKWDKTWVSKDGNVFLVTNYRIENRKIIDFFIYSKKTYQGTNDKQYLLHLGNLSEDSQHYQIKFVATKENPKLFTGVIVLPKEKLRP